MAEIHEEASTDKPAKQSKPSRDLELDEEADNVADFMEVSISPALVPLLHSNQPTIPLSTAACLRIIQLQLSDFPTA